MVRAAIEGRKQDVRDLMGQAGMLDADPTLTADELYQWWAELLHEIIAAPQPATYTPDSTARIIRNLFDTRDRDHPIARITVPEEHAFASRVQLNIISICATLGATVPARAIADDIDGVAEPITELGKQHHAWVRERGLPSALDHHDHP